jgi:hypothetical protein
MFTSPRAHVHLPLFPAVRRRQSLQLSEERSWRMAEMIEEIFYILAIPSWEPTKVSPFQGFAPGLFQTASYLVGVPDFPSDISELAMDPAMYSLIVTAKMNDVDPQAWLADVLARIAIHPAHRLNELLPWNWTPGATSAQAA